MALMQGPYEWNKVLGYFETRGLFHIPTPLNGGPLLLSYGLYSKL